MICDLELKDFREAARTIVNERDIFGREEQAPRFDVDNLLETMREAAKAVQPLKTSCVDLEDDAYKAALDLEADLARADRLDPANRESFFRNLGVTAHKGKQEHWNPKEACKKVKAQLKAVKDAQEAYTKASDAHLNWALKDQLRAS
jgi:hypothetical protein